MKYITLLALLGSSKAIKINQNPTQSLSVMEAVQNMEQRVATMDEDGLQKLVDEAVKASK